MKLKIYLLSILLCSFCGILNAQSWIPLNGPVGIEIYKSMMTSDGNIYSFVRSNEVYTSKDKGLNWDKVRIPPISRSACSIALAAESPSKEVFIHINCALYKINHLDNSVELLNRNVEFDHVYISNSGIVFGIIWDKLFISNDGGRNFIQKKFIGNIVSITPIEKDLNLIQINTNFKKHEIWTMKDDGSLILTQISNIEEYKIFHHKKSNKIFAFNNNSFVSEDKGTSWIPYKPEVTNGLLSNAIELPDGSILGSGLNQYYLSKDSGTNWSSYTGYFATNRQPYIGEHFINEDNELYIDNYDQKILVDRNRNKKIIEVKVNKPEIAKMYQINKLDIFAITTKGLQYSHDDGKTWRTIFNNKIFYSDLLFFKDGSLLFSDDNHLFLSNDLGTKWTPIVLPPNLYRIYNKHIVITSKDEIRIFDSQSKTIFISANRGKSWTTILGSNMPYSPLGFNLSENDILYTYNLHDGRFYYSLDLGIIWFNPPIIFNQKSEPILTNNSQLIKHERGPLDTSQIIYTDDFGLTYSSIKVPNNYEYFSNDRFGNCYLINAVDLENSAILNINTKQLINADFSQIFENDLWNIYTGDNGCLYAFTEFNTIHKYYQKLNSTFSQLSGNIIIDENQNCKMESNENRGFPYQIAIKSQNNLIFHIPVSISGYFKTLVSAGSYQMQLSNSNTLWQECNFPKNIQFNGNDSANYNDLVVKPIQWCSDIRVHTTVGRLRRCFENNLAHIFIKNYGSKNAKDVKVKLIMDDYFDNIVSSFSPSFQQGRIFEFIIPEIKINETYTIYFTFKVSCNAQLNQVHCIKALFDNEEQCNHILPLSDTILSCEKNIGSFDPNDKMAYTNGVPLTNKITSDQDIEYLIRFQNTGTDTAFKVVIRDQLDKNLDWNSFEVLSSSHPYSFTMDDGGLLTFLFKDILLPDSSINVVASNGYIKYSIKQKDNIALGTVIHNEAAIYFDYNEPVWTNNVSLQLVSPSKTKNYSQDILLTIMPNPFSTRASISLPKELEDQEKLIKIFDLHGKEIIQFKSMEKSIELINDHFTNGIYLVKVFAKNGRTGIAKFVVKK
jgi:uncharacterized repeat protein (TIGR01451 family)